MILPGFFFYVVMRSLLIESEKEGAGAGAGGRVGEREEEGGKVTFW